MDKKWKKIIRQGAVCISFAVIGAVAFLQYRQERLAERLSEKVLRFHVLANSDSKEDQALKLKVRDAIGVYMQQEMKEASNLPASRRIIREDMDGIVHTAESVIAAEGYSYGVSASLARVDFPRKIYGSYTFPPGNYEALQVSIGQGKGRNWWCVMYPNMCFFDSVYEEENEAAVESLQNTLTEEEYTAIMESGDYEIAYKLLDFLN